MVSFRAAAAALVAVPFVSAMIGGVEPYVGTYKPTDTSTFPVSFTSSWTKVTYYDLTVSFGLIKPEDLVTSQNNSIGMPVKKNLDLIALNKTYIGETTTFDIPLPVADFYAGPGDYILTALVTGVNGVVPTLIPFSYKLRIPFQAEY